MTYYKLYSRCSAREFVEFWQRFYQSKISDEVYQVNLNVGVELTKENVSLLWRWKNERYGWPLVEPTQAILGDINSFRKLEHVDEVKEREFWQLVATITHGIVWQVFVFHMARSQDYPIFDQHVMRAYLALTTGYIHRNPREVEAPCGSYERFSSSYSGYRSFFFHLVKEASAPEPKDVDCALWAFGRHLKRLHRTDGPLPLGESGR
jgi:hypothetical protein